MHIYVTVSQDVELIKEGDWYLNGKCHRIDGPAVEFADGSKYWFLNGIECTEAEFKKKIAKNSKGSCEGKIVEIENFYEYDVEW